MASRWFVFWIAMFVIASIQGNDSWWVWLILAALTSDDIGNLIKRRLK